MLNLSLICHCSLSLSKRMFARHLTMMIPDLLNCSIQGK